MAELKRVLIANRGEIAIRIANAAAALGLESVAVYAPADARSLHTRAATVARALGDVDGSPVGAYLDIDALLSIATETGCDCVHPGYGFLAESDEFAQRCAAAGLVFVGPPPAALALFGDKVRARAFAAEIEIPVVPGSAAPVGSGPEAVDCAAELGYPVLLKAAAGGGGRGMREVASAAGMAEAFARCQSEAEAAFGDGAVFVEKLVARPRHIEVQVLADRAGNVVHLHERDCSIQLRHQKVVEAAPAPGLDDALRQHILDAAVRLAERAGYVNAGTVEFLATPEDAGYYFIECNPRIQVEHTVTEQVTGIDLVEAQFRLAAGADLAALGLRSQGAVPNPRGFAVQARVVARGTGSLRAYKPPAGAGVRVDGCGYVGYAPPPAFDPLLAKVVCGSNSSGTFASALERTARALDEFHVEGLATNLGQLKAILSHDAVRAGDARTTLLEAEPTLLAPAAAGDNGTLALLRQQATLAGLAGLVGSADGESTAAPVATLAPQPGEQAVACPMAGSVLEVRVREGDAVAAGETLLIVSAMKMESQLLAPCAGTVTAAQPLSPGDSVEAGRVVATIAPADGAAAGEAPAGKEDSWAPLLADIAAMQRLALERLAPGSTDPGVVRQRSRGKLTCRERIDLLLDAGTFREVGSVAGFASYGEDGTVEAFTPANHVGGTGRIDGRGTVVCADDFTSRGGHADGAIGAKSSYLDRLSIELKLPSVRLLDGSSGGGSVAAMVPAQKRAGESSAKESTGAITAGRPRVAGGGGSFLPGHLGSAMYGEQLATVPVVNVLLGSVVGIGAAKAVLGHFSVMVKDIAQLFVAGPPVVAHAMGYDITKEDLGGWHIHCKQRLGRQPSRDRRGSRRPRPPLSLLPAGQRLRGAAGAAGGRSAEPARGSAVRSGAAPAHRHLRHAPGDSAAGGPRLLLRDRAVVGHRSDHRLRALQRPPAGRHRLRQPARQRRRTDCGRLPQAHAAPGPVRSVPSAGAEPGGQPRLRRRPGARDHRHHPARRRVDGGLRPNPGADLHGADAAQLRRRWQQLRHPGGAALGAGGLAGGRRRRHSAGGRHRGGVQAAVGPG